MDRHTSALDKRRLRRELDAYRELLDQSEAAIRLDEGRAAHKGATPHLRELANEVRQIVRTLDGRNRIRLRTTRSCWANGSAPAGWDAACGRRCEARSVMPGRVSRQRWRRAWRWKED